MFLIFKILMFRVQLFLAKKIDGEWVASVNCRIKSPRSCSFEDTLI